MMTETVRLIQPGNLKIPLLLSFVRASFPSPADDYKERPLDLDELVIQHPEATFYVRVSGESMQDAGIDDGDVLVVDRAIDARHNAIIVAILNGKFTVKRLHQENEATYLVPANPMYRPVRVTEDMNFQVWGVVTENRARKPPRLIGGDEAPFLVGEVRGRGGKVPGRLTEEIGLVMIGIDVLL